MISLKGILPAITTPFRSDGTVDLTGLRANFTNWHKTGLTGYLVLGSTGEVVHLDEAEKLELLTVARASIPDTMSMIVGTGLHSTRATILFTRQAAAAGGDYALVVTPHYFKSSMTQTVLRDFYCEVADASPIPVLLYSVPQFTGVTLQPETIAVLAEHRNIVGIKDSAGDVRALIHTLSLVPKDFVVLTGSAPVLYPALAVGAQGAILAIANLAPTACVEIYRLLEANQLADARTYQERLLILSEEIATRYGIGGIKYAMDCVGYIGGDVRSPLTMPNAAARQAIRTSLQECKFFENLKLMDN
ncbi:MAG: dihydrodipicolinate synthase family protein [Acidobacteriota bacterium]